MLTTTDCRHFRNYEVASSGTVLTQHFAKICQIGSNFERAIHREFGDLQADFFVLKGKEATRKNLCNFSSQLTNGLRLSHRRREWGSRRIVISVVLRVLITTLHEQFIKPGLNKLQGTKKGKLIKEEDYKHVLTMVINNYVGVNTRFSRKEDGDTSSGTVINITS